MALAELLIFLSIILLLLYKWSMARYDVFRRRGVAHLPPQPLLGNVPLSLLLNRGGSYLRHSIEQHQQLKHNKVYGVYNFREPLYYLADASLIRQVGIQHFDNFANHRPGISDTGETLLSKSLLSLRDGRWKRMRSTLTPAFTGSKLRHIFGLVHDCNKEAVSYIERELETDGFLELELKQFFTRYTNDVIATAAFGIQVNSFVDEQNEFFTLGRRVSQFSFWGGLKVLLYMLLPRLMKLLRVPVLDERNVAYFKDLVFSTIKVRREQRIVRPDMLQQLLEAQRQSRDEDKDFSDEDLLAQCLLFFSAGFETVSSCLSFTSHELLANEQVQQRLYEEIAAVEAQLEPGQSLDYDTLMAMKYLDCVVSESLRKWPPAIVIDRQCAESFDLLDENGDLLLTLRQGELVHIPIVAIHHDADNFPEPEKFRPERFDEEHKHEIKPFSYLPFGIGQRSCIGNRLALMEVKLLLYQLLLRFRLLPAERTSKNLMDSIAGFRMEPRELFWCRLEPRATPPQSPL